MDILFYYIIVINIIAFFVYGIDKRKAKKNKWRISENILIGLAIIGGGLGAYCGMQIFRHKTQHIKFIIAVPVLLILWFIGIVYFKFMI